MRDLAGWETAKRGVERAGATGLSIARAAHACVVSERARSRSTWDAVHSIWVLDCYIDGFAHDDDDATRRDATMQSDSESFVSPRDLIPTMGEETFMGAAWTRL